MSERTLTFAATVRGSASARSIENGTVAVLVLEVPIPAPMLATGAIYRVQMRRATKRPVRRKGHPCP